MLHDTRDRGRTTPVTASSATMQARAELPEAVRSAASQSRPKVRGCTLTLPPVRSSRVIGSPARSIGCRFIHRREIDPLQKRV
jgi:hypothetical protein